MLIKDSIVINASPDKVWKYVGLPEQWGLFYNQVDGCELVSHDSGRIGSVYTIGFGTGDEKNPTRCTIVDLQPGRMIQVQSVAADPTKPLQSAMITFALEDQGTRTRVRVRIEIAAPGTSVLVRALLSLLVWFFSCFGYQVGEPTLMKLKRIVEGS